MPDRAAASTIDDLVRSRAAQHGAKPMVIDPASRVGYHELDATTRELAAALVDAGVGKGTRVGLIMPNSARWVQVAVAVTRIGAVLVPLSTLLRAGELAAQLRTASVQFLVSVAEFRGHRYLDDFCGTDVHRLKSGLTVTPKAIEASIEEIKKWGSKPWCVAIHPQLPIDYPLDHPDRYPLVSRA